MSNLQLISNSLIGGNIISLMSQQYLRLSARASDIALLNKKAALTNQYVNNTPPKMIGVAGIPVSTRKQEVYTYDSQITNFPVENGTIISDHVILQPIKVDLQCDITNWNGVDDAVNAINILEDMRAKRNRLELVTEHNILENMVLANFTIVNELPNWGGIRLDMKFQQVQYILLQNTTIPPANVTSTSNTSGPTVDLSASDTIDKGNQQPTNIDLQAMSKNYGGGKKYIFDQNGGRYQ